MGFSIDDVRETFTADAGSLIARLQTAAEALLGSPRLHEQRVEYSGRSPFEAMVDLGHALRGTTALVGAQSLTDTARLLEETARMGQESLRQMELHAARARVLGSICRDGALQMRQMLAMELTRRPAEALGMAQTFARSAAALASAPATAALAVGAGQDDPERTISGDEEGEVAARPAPPAAPPPAAPPPPVTGEAPMEFQFDPGEQTYPGLGDSPLLPPPAPLPSPDDQPGFDFGDGDVSARAPSVSPELFAVFQDEARAALDDLEERLSALRREPRDTQAAAELERLFHTLRGAAATVGMVAVSARASHLQERLEVVLDKGEGASAALVEELITETNEMLGLAGLPEVVVASAVAQRPSELPPALAEAQPLFVEECRGMRVEAEAFLPLLTDPHPATAEGARADLARLFHRLKGSALIVGEKEVAAAAERAQQLLEAEGTLPAAAELQKESREALNVLGEFLRRAGGRPERAETGESPPQPGGPGWGPRSVSAAGGAAAAAGPTPTLPVAPAREPVQVETQGELWEAMQLECNELLESIEREALALEDSAQPKTSLQALMRHFHTCKGVVNTIGIHPTGKLVHALEDFLEKLLEAPILPPMRKVASLVLDVRDAVRRNIGQAHQGAVEVLLPRFEPRMARLLGARAPAAASGGSPSTLQLSGMEEGGSVVSLDDARSRRSVRSVPSAPAARSGDDRDEQIDRKFIRVATERLDTLMNLAGELVVSRSRLLARAASLRQIQTELHWGSRRLLESVETFREENEFTNLDGRKVRRRRGGSGARKPARAVAVAPGTTTVAGRPAWSGFGELELDRYEEIHILSRTLTEITSDFTEMNGQLARGLASLTDDSDSFDKLISGIQSEVTRARMVTLEVLFTRLKLPVRDAATREGKEVRVAAEGVDVALDKTIADALFAPMLHLVRNAVVHGIERIGVREAKHKPRSGTITLIARQHAGQIGIEVRDDGAGLDLQALHGRGLAMGLIGADVPLTDPAVRELVFQPGLTTRAQAGAVSGRGVGCDVVRRAVERLGGSIRVESEPGRGAAFLITLPVSLAITKALLVRSHGHAYAIPLHFAERMVEAAESVFVESAGVKRVKLDGQLLPVTTFDRHFGRDNPDGQRPAGRAVILLRVGDHRLALEVDEVTGQEEVVVKSLGPFLAGHPLFAGVTIRGSGELVLIVDVAGLLQNASRGAQPARAVRPLAPAAARTTEARTTLAGLAPPAPAAPRTGLPLRVLFIDDSLSVRKFAEMTLKSLGVEVTLAVDGLDGMNKVRSETFDLVFTDLEMPRMHGFELISELRFLPDYKNLPVIVVTSRSGQKHQQQARSLGATDYLTKPFSAATLETALKRWGKRRAAVPGKPEETGAS
jgi:chemosensory pili system protein ChpA (sensor histidine kinase/response regulator)